MWYRFHSDPVHEYNVLTGKDLRRIIVVAEGLIFLVATRGQTRSVSFTRIKQCQLRRREPIDRQPDWRRSR